MLFRIAILVVALFALLPAAMGVGLTEAETVARCRQQLRPEAAVAERRQAAQVVGKYNGVAVSQLLMEALKDPDTEVRYNALVSAGENYEHLVYCAPGILGMIKDGDVTIRRLASSLGPQCIYYARRSRGKQPAAMTSGQLTEIISRGLQDQDREVRNNTLVICSRAVCKVPGALLRPFFQEESSERIILALSAWLYCEETPENKVQLLKKLLSHPLSVIRSQVVSKAVFLGEPGAELLQLGLQDKEAAVKCAALTALCRQHRLPLQEVKPMAQAMFDDANLPAESKQRLLEAIATLNTPEVRDYCKNFLNEPTPVELRRSAWQIFSFRRQWLTELPRQVLLETAANESDRQIRQRVKGLLLRRQKEVTLPELQQLQTSGNPEGRLWVLELMMPLGKSDQALLIQEALLDDDSAVRAKAVQYLGQLRLTGWKADLLITLQESDPIVSKAAAYGLVQVAGQDEQVADALQNYLRSRPDPALKRRLDLQLKDNKRK